jgi:hypothetical protein
MSRLVSPSSRSPLIRRGWVYFVQSMSLGRLSRHLDFYNRQQTTPKHQHHLVPEQNRHSRGETEIRYPVRGLRRQLWKAAERF